jgi:LPXTG-motif cell wall-anchored protein
VAIDSSADLAAPLALIGLALGAAGYYLLIRRRRRESDAAADREIDRVRRRARSRFRRLERHDGPE